MSEAEDIEVVASGLALNQVSQWLGVSAEEVLQDPHAEIDHMFDNPHPQLLGLGAKYLSHKSMEKSGVEMKLKHRLKQSLHEPDQPQYEPAQLHRHHKRRKHDNTTAAGKVEQGPVMQQQDSDEEETGKLHRLKQPGHSSSSAKASKVLDRQQLLAVPVENLSKWQKKRMRQKEKKTMQQQQTVQ